MAHPGQRRYKGRGSCAYFGAPPDGAAKPSISEKPRRADRDGVLGGLDAPAISVTPPRGFGTR